MWYSKIKTYFGDMMQDMDAPLVLRKNCDIGGCPHLGDYRAPKSRYNLQDYYWFCLDHVREYNKNWDFFKGMSQGEMENHMYKTGVWDRPTWRATQAGFNEEKAKKAVYEGMGGGENIFQDFTFGGEETEAKININNLPHPTIDALATFDLAPPVEWEEVKARYKTLAKKYHPDTNKNDKKAEELFKKISLAYTILKLSYQNYTKLDE